MTISIENADAYFSRGNHVRADIWLKFTHEHRAGAVATARRMFEHELKRPLREDETDESLAHREDYACYEQALWLLMGTPVSDAANGDAAGMLLGDAEPQTNSSGKRPRWSDEALRWFNWGGGVTIRC